MTSSAPITLQQKAVVVAAAITLLQKAFEREAVVKAIVAELKAVIAPYRPVAAPKVITTP